MSESMFCFQCQETAGCTGCTAFLSPNVANVLIENFGIGGITKVEDDLKIFLE